MLGYLDEKLKTYLLAFHKGGIINTVVAIATAEGLIEKSDNKHLKLIDLVRFFSGKKYFSLYGFRKKSCNYLETRDS